MKIKEMRFTLEELENLENGDGATLSRFNRIAFEDGYEVATDGIETSNPLEAWAYILQNGGSCGVWFEDGIYYIDHSKHIEDYEEAVDLGRKCNQISILDWETMECIYL